MWKASAGHAVSITQDDGGADDWETDPDFVVGITTYLSLKVISWVLFDWVVGLFAQSEVWVLLVTFLFRMT
jgi:hypothetical protein